MIRWTSVLVGAAAFFATHAGLIATWAWVGPEWTPWFLNSGRAVLLTMGVFVVGGLLASVLARDRHEILVQTANFAAGAIGAMIVILVAVVGIAPLFPMAIAIGSMLIVVSCFAGALIGYRFKRG